MNTKKLGYNLCDGQSGMPDFVDLVSNWRVDDLLSTSHYIARLIPSGVQADVYKNLHILRGMFLTYV